MRETPRRRRGVLAALAACAALAASARAQVAPTIVSSQTFAVGVSSIVVSWTGGSATGNFFVVTSTDGVISGPLSTAATTYTIVNLSTNTPYSFMMEATGPGTADSSTSTVVTLAAQPSGTALIGGNLNAVTLSWLANGNPAGTLYNVDWFVAGSTPASAPVVFSTTAVAGTSVTATVNDLPGGQTVFFEVQAVNSAGAPTPF